MGIVERLKLWAALRRVRPAEESAGVAGGHEQQPAAELVESAPRQQEVGDMGRVEGAAEDEYRRRVMRDER